MAGLRTATADRYGIVAAARQRIGECGDCVAGERRQIGEQSEIARRVTGDGGHVVELLLLLLVLQLLLLMWVVMVVMIMMNWLLLMMGLVVLMLLMLLVRKLLVHQLLLMLLMVVVMLVVRLLLILLLMLLLLLAQQFIQQSLVDRVEVQIRRRCTVAVLLVNGAEQRITVIHWRLLLLLMVRLMVRLLLLHFVDRITRRRLIVLLLVLLLLVLLLVLMMVLLLQLLQLTLLLLWLEMADGVGDRPQQVRIAIGRLQAKRIYHSQEPLELVLLSLVCHFVEAGVWRQQVGVL